MSRTFNKAWCMFEQSGTFKNEFKKLGIDAVDLDIQNNFGETDCVIDLFAEIEKGFEGGASIFDNISKEDVCFAFFPCIYFETLQMTYYDLSAINYRGLTESEKVKDVIDRIQKRNYFHTLLYKLYYIFVSRELKLVIENPATKPNYLVGSQNFVRPTMIDNDRTKRGDFFKKPTAYWFVNFEPTFGTSYQQPKERKRVDRCKSAPQAGLCSEERSLISPDYARNFICDFVLGKEQNIGQGSFDFS